MSTDPPELSIIIPTWNGRALLAACLESLARQTYTGFETIVVDDGSTDGTASYLREQFPEVRVLVRPANGGFVAAVNHGLADARGAWVFLLNNDVTLANDCLALLMEEARAGRFEMLAPLVLWTDDPQLVYSAGDLIGTNGRPTSLGYRDARDSLVVSGPPFGVSGGYGLFKKDLLNEVGLLDTAFAAYFEDADLCFRARWAGFEAGFVADAIAWHVGSATIQDRLWWRTRQCYRNHALLVIKNFSGPMLCWNAGPLIRERRHQLSRVFAVARNEWGAVRAAFYTASAWLGLMARIPGALRARRRVMANRKLTSAEMQALLAGKDRDA